MKKLKTVREILEFISERIQHVANIKEDDAKDAWAKEAILEELDNLRAMIEE